MPLQIAFEIDLTLFLAFEIATIVIYVVEFCVFLADRKVKLKVIIVF